MVEPHEDLLKTILKGVSRSFFVSLRILPRSLRLPIGLAYLFARAADTIADTALLSRAQRLEYLELFRSEFQGDGPSRIREVKEALTGFQQTLWERELLDRLEECFALYRVLAEEDQERVRRLLLTLTQGMIMDLTAFPGEEGGLQALKTRADLDGYTYYVAGCVGEFWTEIHMAHRPRLRGWDAEAMKRRGVRFGKGLQMTNILRDLSRDLRIGRCYLPQEDLDALGVSPQELLNPKAIVKVRPLLQDLLFLTLDHYREGWAYTLAIPRREIRMRLSCAWPLFIGLKTLALVEGSENLLDPRVIVKIPRREVYAILLGSSILVGSNRGLDGYYQRLRRIPSLLGRWSNP